VVLDVALAASHAHLERLLGDRGVREHTDPHLAAALDIARHGAARRLEFASRHARPAGRLQAVLAEGDVVAALGESRIAPLELLAVFGAFGLQHGRLLWSLACGFAPRPQAEASPVCVAWASPDSALALGSGWLNTSPLKIQTFTPMIPYVVFASPRP